MVTDARRVDLSCRLPLAAHHRCLAWWPTQAVGPGGWDGRSWRTTVELSLSNKYTTEKTCPRSSIVSRFQLLFRRGCTFFCAIVLRYTCIEVMVTGWDGRFGPVFQSFTSFLLRFAGADSCDFSRFHMHVIFVRVCTCIIMYTLYTL